MPSLLVIVVLIGILFLFYRRDKQSALRQLRSNSQLMQTPTGQLEYATKGQGYPVVVLHGTGGGYEQGLLFDRLLDPAHYQLIVLSRSGHRRTPLSTGPTFEDQADSIIQLLDALNIPNAAVLGISGGGPAALQFALRFPERCRALVLLSAHGPATLQFMPPRIILSWAEVMVSADFLFWLLLKLPSRLLLLLEGSRWQRLQAADKRAFADVFLQGAFPATDWKDGLFNDVNQLFALEGKDDWPLEQIKTTTLILHGQRDLVVRFSSAQLHAKRIPSSKLISFEDGTHMSFVTHSDEIRQALSEFLQ